MGKGHPGCQGCIHREGCLIYDKFLAVIEIDAKLRSFNNFINEKKIEMMTEKTMNAFFIGMSEDCAFYRKEL